MRVLSWEQQENNNKLLLACEVLCSIPTRGLASFNSNRWQKNLAALGYKMDIDYKDMDPSFH